MERPRAFLAWRRLRNKGLRTSGIIFICLVGMAACIQDGNDRVAVDTRSTNTLPTVTPISERTRDVRATNEQGTPQPAAPARPTPTLVPTATQPSQAVQPSATSQPAPASPPSQGQVVYAGEEGLNLRSEPNQQKIAALLKDSFVTVRGAAREEGGFRWWPVAIEAGWMVEGPADPAKERWLVPVNSEQLVPGQQARVAYPEKDGLNLRRTAGPEGEKLATLLQGSLVTVIGGPTQVNGTTWWQVKVAEGWLSEGATDPSQPRWMLMQP